MAKTVTVSLLHPMILNLGDGNEIKYKAGMREMPYEHAQQLGVLRRIRAETVTPDSQAMAMTDPLYIALNSVLDEKTAALLAAAGYSNLAELSKASRDTLLAIEGIGPARYVEIQTALGRRMSDDGEEA